MKTILVILILAFATFVNHANTEREKYIQVSIIMYDNFNEHRGVMERQHWIDTRKAVADECGGTQKFIDEYLITEVC